MRGNKIYVVSNVLIPNTGFENEMLFDEMKYSHLKPYVLYLGRIDPKKNLGLLLYAWEQIRELNINLIIAGDVSDNVGYSKYLYGIVNKLDLKSRIHFTKKRVEGREKEWLYKNASLFVLPSHTENFALVVLEAIAAGTLVITTKNTPWEELEINNAGFWVNNDTNSFAEAIRKALNLSDKELNEMKRNSKILLEKYSTKELSPAYLKMFNEVLKNDND